MRQKNDIRLELALFLVGLYESVEAALLVLKKALGWCRIKMKNLEITYIKPVYG
ncbi:MAG: hypothetical protein ACT6RN_27505 [Agrobacterium sp.]|uniref:hypothetical protein n=1 Tax=Agrobacterium sp. TaxID=361 RepID=UPI004037F5BD